MATAKLDLAPNGRSCKARVGKLWFELFESGGVTKIEAWPNCPCGFIGTHWIKMPPGPFEDMAKKAAESWKSDRKAWSECE